MRLVLLPLLIVSLSGCKVLMDPSPMPSAYHFHNRVYSAPDGPDSKDLGYEYSEQQNQKILKDWNRVTSDLVMALKNQLGVDPRPVYIDNKNLPLNPFNVTFDQSLRASLAQSGYSVVTNPGIKTHIYFEALHPDNEKYDRHNVIYNDSIRKAEPYPVNRPSEFIYRLNVAERGTAVGRVQVQRHMPAYGYKMREGVLSSDRGFYDLNQ